MDFMGLVGKFSGGNSNVAGVVTDLISQSGGLDGVVSKFKTAGFDQQVMSWLGDGPNQAISGEAIQKVLGSPMIAGFAAKLGMDSTTVATQIAKILPEVINAMSSGGSLTSVASGLMGKLTGDSPAAGITDSLKKLF